MAEITDPVVLAFLRDRVRPRAEQIRALLHLLQDDRAEFLAESILGRVPAGSDIIQDDRLAEGIPPMTADEFRTLAVNRYGELLAVLEAAGAMVPIDKACVRPLAVSLRE